VDIVGEWALMFVKKMVRNEFGHTFGDHFNAEVRDVAMDILKNLLDDPFCNGFKHVVALSNFNLTYNDTKNKPMIDSESWISEVCIFLQILFYN
jgi:hypothetical protein